MNNFNDICPPGNGMIEGFWECEECGAKIWHRGYCDHCSADLEEVEDDRD